MVTGEKKNTHEKQSALFFLLDVKKKRESKKNRAILRIAIGSRVL